MPVLSAGFDAMAQVKPAIQAERHAEAPGEVAGLELPSRT